LRHSPPRSARSPGRLLLASAFGGLRGALVSVIVISGVINLLALTGSLYMLQVYDRVLTSHSVPTLIALSVMAVILFACQGVLDVLRNQASGRAATLFDRRVAALVQRLVVHQPLTGVSRSSAQQPLRDVDTIRTFLALCLGGMAAIMALTYVTERKSKDMAEQAAQADSHRRAIADANARSAEALQAMGFADRAVTRFETANQRFLALQTSASDIIANLSGVSKVFRLILQSAVLGLGAYLTVRGELTAGAIIAASITTSRALAPIEQVIAHWRSFAAARNSFERLSGALDALPQSRTPVTLEPPRERLSMENATVVIPGTQRVVLHNISFDLQAGQALAIIGPSAAGKSSIARALTGVWPLARGAIRLDGAEFDRWTASDLGQQIGYVPQDVVLFEGTIAENISRLEPEPESSAIVAAAKAANIHEMILGMSDGYETRVGPDGGALSAGQRQRVALARALYRDPFLVVLDEPNSNLDADGEAALTGAIRGIRDRNGIVIVIAHRPSALAAVDRVAMISGGQLTAFGPTEDVLKQVLRQPLAAVARPAS
jgi:ATP-binding cassette, subfamily C, bacterial